MEYKGILTTDKFQKKFLLLLFLSLTIIIISLVVLSILSTEDSIILYRLLILLMIFILFSIALLLSTVILAIFLLYYQFNIPKAFKKMIRASIAVIYPILLFLGKILHYDKNSIRRAYMNLNNRLILSDEYGFEGEKILVLTPHCIQKSSCPYRLTSNVMNCKKCGSCNIGELIELKEQYGVQFHVVTGGTLARKVVENVKPEAIIAIACERDLISGLQEIRNIPVITIVNQRPQGPCINTFVDLNKVEKAIIHFIKE